MTANQGFVKPQRRPGELGAHSLDHLHFVVPDLTAAEAFHSDFGPSISCRWTATGRATTTRRKIHSTSGGRTRRRTSFTTMRPEACRSDRFDR
jgi:hypothetical protein